GHMLCFFFSSRRRHTRSKRDWSSDVCSSDLMQLTVLGVGTFGGASKIDATTGTVLATAFSVSIKGMSPQVAISSIAVPVAAIMVQLDVLARFANTYFAHRIDHLIEENNYNGSDRNCLYCANP